MVSELLFAVVLRILAVLILVLVEDGLRDALLDSVLSI